MSKIFTFLITVSLIPIASTYAQNNQKSSVTYSGTGSYTCTGKSYGCAVVEQGTRQNNTSSLDRYRYESDAAQARIDARRREDEILKRDNYR